MLKVHLPALARGEVRVEEQIAADAPLWEGTDVTFAEPVRVDLGARSVGEGVLIRGTARTAVSGHCRRCLTPVRQAVDEVLDFLFLPPEGEDPEDMGGEVYPLPVRGLDLDISEALREQLLLRIPEYPLCRDECRGLCPSCGTDLNEVECSCVPEAAPSPWDALKKLERKQNDGRTEA